MSEIESEDQRNPSAVPQPTNDPWTPPTAHSATPPPPFASSPFAAPFSNDSPFGQGLPGSPFPSQDPAPYSQPMPSAMAYELRPLSIGEILDRTFSLYRRNFWLYAGLASIAAAITTLGTFVRLTYGFTGVKVDPTLGPKTLLISGIISLVTIVVYFIAYSVTQAATVRALSDAYLERETSIRKSLEVVRRYWLRYIGIVLWQAGSAMWLPIVLFTAGIILLIPALHVEFLGAFILIAAVFSFVYSVIAYIRNSLGIAASVVENLGVRLAMRRSKNLVAGRKGRIFAVLLLMYVLSIVAGVAQGIPAIFFVLTKNGATHIALEALTLLTTFLSAALVAPVGAIALCLVYIDERVRREGYDVETLMERAAGGPATPPPPFATPSAYAYDSSPFSNPEFRG